jgi:hydrogenase maturation protease
MKTLVVGIGNPTRSDDGVGPEVARRIAGLGLAGVEVRTVQQLQVELTEEWAQVDRVAVVDAAATGPAVGLDAVSADGAVGSGVSHQFSPAALLVLTRRLHGRAPEAVLCTVRGEEFGFGESLSPRTAGRVNEAVERIVHWVQTPPRRAG